MSDVCGRRRLVKLVFVTGASGHLRERYGRHQAAGGDGPQFFQPGMAPGMGMTPAMDGPPQPQFQPQPGVAPGMGMGMTPAMGDIVRKQLDILREEPLGQPLDVQLKWWDQQFDWWVGQLGQWKDWMKRGGFKVAGTTVLWPKWVEKALQQEEEFFKLNEKYRQSKQELVGFGFELQQTGAGETVRRSEWLEKAAKQNVWNDKVQNAENYLKFFVELDKEYGQSLDRLLAEEFTLQRTTAGARRVLRPKWLQDAEKQWNDWAVFTDAYGQFERQYQEWAKQYKAATEQGRYPLGP